MLNKAIYILISGTTFSLKEHLTYQLRALRQTTVIGERSYGGGRAFDPVVIDTQFYMRIPRIEIVNPLTSTMYSKGEGMQADIPATSDEAPRLAYQLALERLIGDETDEQERRDMQFVIRTLKPAAIGKAVLPAWSGPKRFGELVFEVRNAYDMLYPLFD